MSVQIKTERGSVRVIAPGGRRQRRSWLPTPSEARTDAREDDRPAHRPFAPDAPIPGIHHYSGCDPDHPRVVNGVCEGCGETACSECGLGAPCECEVAA